MITNVFMHPCVIFIFSILIILLLQTTSANQLAAVGGEGDGSGVINKCIENERRALLDFRTRIQEDPDFPYEWVEEDCCIWRGVSCDDSIPGHVIYLSLDGLVGEIGPSLLNLTYLTSLYLSYNSFNGTIPIFIGYMTQLELLYLNFNNFNGTIPSSIGSLSKLRYLYLNFNNFNGTIPSSIGSLRKLREFRLSINNLYGNIPLEFGNLTKLQEFSLECSGRCVIDVDWLTGLSHLENLHMEGIFLAKVNHWENAIQSLQKLSFLNLSKCDLSQAMYPASSFNNSSSSSIVTLGLANNNLTSSMYGWLFPLTSNMLRYLDLSGNMLEGVPKYFGNLCGLDILRFDDNSAVVDFSHFLNNFTGCTSAKLPFFSAVRGQFIGSLSNEILKFSSLRSLYLSFNHLNGTISEKVWELPNLFTLDVSSNYLSGTISENIGKSKVWEVNLSNNSLKGVSGSSEDHVANSSYVFHINLTTCLLGPRFPKWIQKLKNLTIVDISNNRISDTIPLEFWAMWPSQITYLNLSSNNISGEVLDLSSIFDAYPVIDLSSNNLYGVIPNVTSSVSLLNLSRNKFHGGITFLCQIGDEFLEYLDLSNNYLSGQIPNCLWHFKELRVLNLGHNNLFGRLPTSLQSLIRLEVLYLYKNNFSGELPLSLKNCTSLNYLNLGDNNFSGNLPVWIGENLSGLYVFILRSNNFSGTIPLQLCRLVSLQLLDLSRNNFYGTIPSCLNNLTSMVQEGFIPTRIVHGLWIPWYGSRIAPPEYVGNEYIDHATIEWQGNIREFSRINLGLLRSIDLSSNNLTGQLPYELTDLRGLLALNLSKNALHGKIPREIGNMEKLLNLDISRNNFSGGIPLSMSHMASLNYLDVSYNNLSGRIPTGTQLQSFPPLWYIGNAGICGPPVTKHCPGDEESQVPPLVDKSEGGEEDKDKLQRLFYIGGGVGFATGFWVTCGSLVLNHKWRHAFFQFLSRLKDWIYVQGGSVH